MCGGWARLVRSSYHAFDKPSRPFVDPRARCLLHFTRHLEAAAPPPALHENLSDLASRDGQSVTEPPAAAHHGRDYVIEAFVGLVRNIFEL